MNGSTVSKGRVFHLMLAVSALMAACGGGSSTPESQGAPATQSGSGPTQASAPSPATSPAPATSSSPTEGPAYYFSDCQTGAAAGCVAGSNANAGTSASAPKRDLSGFNFNALPAGSRLLFNRGGAWNHTMIRFENNNVTPASPLVVDAYGSGAPPVWRTAASHAIEFGNWQNTTNDGGYTIRNLKLDGLCTGEWGLWLRDNVRNVMIENVEITGFAIAVHSQSSAPHGVTGTVMRNSTIHRNRSMGLLGQFEGALIEGNVFEANNFSGSTFNHAIYLSGNQHGGSNGVMRNNRFINNSTVNGVCQGGNVTAHGQMSNRLIEGNLIQQDSSAGGCYGFSITPGYFTPEWFRNFVVRGNTVVNLGNCAICAGAAPGILVQGNTIVQLNATLHRGIVIPTSVDPGGSPTSAGDNVDGGAIVRDNTIYLAQPHHQYSTGVAFDAGAGATTQSNNLTAFGPSQLLEVPSAANGWRCRVSAGAATYGSCAR